MNRKKYFIMGLVIIAISFIVAAIFYPKMPELLPTHYSSNGEPDDFSSKAFALFGLNGIMLAVLVFIYVFANLDPKKANQGDMVLKITFLIIPLLSLFITIVTILYGLGNRVDIGLGSSIGLSIMFIAIGNYLPKVKRNYTVGIKIPWTLDSDYNWNKTHRFSGFIWMIGGLVMLVSNFLCREFREVVFFVTMVIVVLVPMVYSYMIYRKESKK